MAATGCLACGEPHWAFGWLLLPAAPGTKVPAACSVELRRGQINALQPTSAVETGLHIGLHRAPVPGLCSALIHVQGRCKYSTQQQDEVSLCQGCSISMVKCLTSTLLCAC